MAVGGNVNVPFEKQVWAAEQCAQYLGVSKAHFLNAIQHATGFPKPVPLPTYQHAGKERKLESRWRAYEVTSWALCEEITPSSRTAAAST